MKESALTKPARDTFLLSLSTALATAIQALATFGLTKLIPPENFGAWREFVLAAGFTGLLHAGYVDGLQVLWCSPTSAGVQPDVRVALTTLLATHTLWIAIGVAISLMLPNLESFPFFFAAVGLYAFVWNASTALQFRAQCRERFARLSAFSVAYPAIFLVLAGLLVVERSATALHLAIAYCLATAIATIFVLVNPQDLNEPGSESSRRSARLGNLIRVGAPILSLNYTSLGMVNFDKVAAAILFPASPFAIYAFASVLVALINSAIAGGSRVLLPAFARHASRGTLDPAVMTSTRAVIVLWSIAVATYFPAIAIVTRFLPRYTAAVELSRLFFVSSVFLALAQMVHVNASRALHVERTYLRRTWVLLSVGFMAALAVGHWLSMEALAALSLAVSIIWTVTGVQVLTHTGIQAHDRITVVTVVWCGTCFMTAASVLPPLGGAVLYILASAPLWTFWWRRYTETAGKF